MGLENVPAGKALQDDIYVVIEIPANSDPIKYEVDKETGALFVDRFMATAMFYPANYGYVNNTLSSDGDPARTSAGATWIGAKTIRYCDWSLSAGVSGSTQSCTMSRDAGS